jgi:hypothetical protein
MLTTACRHNFSQTYLMSKPNNAATQLGQSMFNQKYKNPQQQQQQLIQPAEFQEFLRQQSLSSSSKSQQKPINNISGDLMKGPSLGSNWAQDFTHFNPKAQQHFEEFDTIYTRGTMQHQQTQWAHDFHSQQPVHEQWKQEFNATAVNAKGKGIMTDSDWSREFQELRLQEDPSLWSQEFEKVAQQDPVQEEGGNWQERFESMWAKMHENPKNQTPGDWEKEFRNLMPEFNPSHYDNNQEGQLDYEVDPVLAELAPYTFEPNNPYLEHLNPFQAGIEIINTRGSLSAAALAFEAAVQRNPTDDVAWQRLGMAQVENEKEGPGSAALQRAVKENPSNVDALMVRLSFYDLRD